MSKYMSVWQSARAMTDAALESAISRLQPGDGHTLEALCFVRDERTRDPKPVLIEADMANLVHPFID